MAMIQSLFFGGFLVGAGVVSRITDSHGRVFTMWWCTILAQVGVLLTVFANGCELSAFYNLFDTSSRLAITDRFQN